MLNGLAAELAFTLEFWQISGVLAEHVPGKLNALPDALSRLSAPGGPRELPKELASCRERQAPGSLVCGQT